MFKPHSHFLQWRRGIKCKKPPVPPRFNDGGIATCLKPHDSGGGRGVNEISAKSPQIHTRFNELSKTIPRLHTRFLPKLSIIPGDFGDRKNFQKNKIFKKIQSLSTFVSNQHQITIRARAALFRVLGLRLAAFAFAEKSSSQSDI